MPDVPDGLGNIVGMYSIADWAASEGKQFSAYEFDASKNWSYYTTLEYTVPAGKKLFITDFGGANYASYAADAGKQQAFDIYIDDVDGVGPLVYTGGQVGIHVHFTPPIIISAGNRVRSEITNQANHLCDQTLYISGFLIDV